MIVIWWLWFHRIPDVGSKKRMSFASDAGTSGFTNPLSIPEYDALLFASIVLGATLRFLCSRERRIVNLAEQPRSVRGYPLFLAHPSVRTKDKVKPPKGLPYDVRTSTFAALQ